MVYEIKWLFTGVIIGIGAIIHGISGVESKKSKSNRYYKMFSIIEIYGGAVCLLTVIAYILVWFV